MIPHKILKKIFNRVLLFYLLILFITFHIPLFAENAAANLENIEEEPGVKGLTPRYPETNPNLIFIEGEDAVSTNFNKEPILNYGCSGKRTLQLSRMKGLQGETGFYADYVFYVEQPGTFEFWYGGTPAGPKEDMFPSYVSPCDVYVDGAKEPFPVLRETIAVVENYTPSYYWNMVKDIELDRGRHRIRFEVNEKRRYDGRYYFYLDCFFFVRKEAAGRYTGTLIPEVFPKNMEDRSIDHPFRAIDDYLIIIRDNPDDVTPLIEISLVFSLMSDYLSAIKYMKRAAIIEPDNCDILHLLAKNYIWKGDTGTGLDLYEELLDKDPLRLDIWLEAGKIAGWTGRISESVQFFKGGLAQFPDNLDLLINLGLTYLWEGAASDADRIFQQAVKAVERDSEKLKALAKIFIINLYPERAIEVYNEAIQVAPDDIELHILLEETCFSMGKKDIAEKVRKRTKKMFIPSERLTEYLELNKEKMLLKEKVMDEYRKELGDQPDNLELREMLAQAFFWNGLRREAIDEYLNILTNQLYRFLKETEQNSFELLQAMDRLYVLKAYFLNVKGIFEKKRRDLDDALNALKSAEKTYASYLDKRQKTQDAGKEFEEPAVFPGDNVEKAKAVCTSNLSDSQKIIARYNTAVKALDAENAVVKTLRDTYDEVDVMFARVVEPIKWEWQRDEMIKELQEVEGKGLLLAIHVLAKIDQMEKRYDDAVKKYNRAGKTLVYADISYAYAQALIWNGDTKAAKEIIEVPESRIMEYAPYTRELVVLIEALNEQFDGSTQSAGEDTAAGCEEMMENLSTLSRDTASRMKGVDDLLEQFHGIHKKTMIRTFYQYEENTYLMRNELGDFYLKEEELGSAIRQYKKVLAIDPWDIGAKYRIGRVYQWNRQWSKAMAQYREVFWADPNYEQATSNYNQLAREHADSLHTKVSYSVDTSRIIWNGEIDYTTDVNELFGIMAEFKTDYYRVFRWAEYGPIKEQMPDPPDMKHYTYQVHDILLGFSFTHAPLNLSVVIAAGVAIETNNELANQEETEFAEFGDDNINLFDFFGFNSAWPYGVVELGYELSPYLSLDLKTRVGIYPETYGYGYTSDYKKRKVLDIAGNCNIGTSFTYIDVPIIKNTSIRACGEIDYLIDDNLDKGYNIIYLGMGEITVKLLEVENPHTELSIYGSFTYQSSTIGKKTTDNTKIDYYSPHDVIIGGGGIDFSTYAELADNFVLGLSPNCGCFYVQQYEVTDQQLVDMLKIQLETTIELTKGDGVFYVTPVFVNLMNLENGTWWKYWNFIIKLGFRAKLPHLLAQ
jgi:tetratricopeptide (TPR) repeat protein